MPSSPSPLPVKPASEGSTPKAHESGISRSHQSESSRDFEDLLDADTPHSSSQKTQHSASPKTSETSTKPSHPTKKTEEEAADSAESAEEPKAKTPVADPRFLFLGTPTTEAPALQTEASLDPVAVSPEGEATPEGDPIASSPSVPSQTLPPTTTSLTTLNPQQTTGQTTGSTQPNGKETASTVVQSTQQPTTVPAQQPTGQGVATSIQQGEQPLSQEAPAEDGQNSLLFANGRMDKAEVPEKSTSPDATKILPRSDGKTLPADLQTQQHPPQQAATISPETIAKDGATEIPTTKENSTLGKPAEQASNPSTAHSKIETKIEIKAEGKLEGKAVTGEVSLPAQASQTAKEAVAETGASLAAKPKEVAPTAGQPSPQAGGENPSQQRQENSNNGNSSFASTTPEIPVSANQPPAPNAAGKTEVFSVPTTAMGTVASGPVRPAQQNADLYADILPLMNRFLDAAETLPSTQRGRIDLNVPLNEESVKIRLEIRNGEVRTSIRTDSEALRAALETSWPEFVNKSETRGIVLGEAKFDSAQQGQNFSDQGQPSRYREQAQQEGGTSARIPRDTGGRQTGGAAPASGQQTTQETPARSGVKLWA